MKIKHADNTWRTDPVDQYRTLITGNRQVRPLQVRQLAQAQGDGQTHAQRVHEAIHEGLHAQRLLGRKGVQDSTWIAFPSFTPACFVEDRETNRRFTKCPRWQCDEKPAVLPDRATVGPRFP